MPHWTGKRDSPVIFQAKHPKTLNWNRCWKKLKDPLTSPCFWLCSEIDWMVPMKRTLSWTPGKTSIKREPETSTKRGERSTCAWLASDMLLSSSLREVLTGEGRPEDRKYCRWDMLGVIIVSVCFSSIRRSIRHGGKSLSSGLILDFLFGHF